jgi:Arc/MetJ family transcription regulator
VSNRVGQLRPPPYTPWCIIVSVARTSIDVDENLVAEAMRRYGLHSKRAAVDLALRRLVGGAMSRDEALAMEGSGWEIGLADLRPGRAFDA